MSICECYEQINTTYCGMPTIISICNGTKERETCLCNGDMAQCDFYPEKRKQANKFFNTAEMWLAAQQDGETYITDYMKTSYSKADGFLSENSQKQDLTLTLNHWMNVMWQKQEKRKLTIEEAEREFCIEIVRDGNARTW